MVNTVMTPSNMAYVLILDVAVIIIALETVSRFVEEIGLPPSTRSVSRLTVYRARKLKPEAASSRVYHLMQNGKFLTLFCVLVPGVLVNL